MIFILAGLAEIGGGYLIWQWLREDKSAYLGLLGGIALILYGVIATWQAFPTFGRVCVRRVVSAMGLGYR